MYRLFWVILFMLTLAYNIYLEQWYVFIYYTTWTFVVEIILFTSLLLEDYSTHFKCLANFLFPIVFAPTILVALGFWILIAPTLSDKISYDFIRIFITHGVNALAMYTVRRPVFIQDMWKPLAYTVSYSVFLVTYVLLGGRSISGKLPYWYCEYDRPVGWLFISLSLVAIALIHAWIARAKPVEQTTTKQCSV